MPAGYSARCRVCNSPHRAEIERWCKEKGLSPRAATAKLLECYSEKITHVTIWRHMIEHFDVRAEAREQYQKSRQQLHQTAQKCLSGIEMLDSITQGEYELHQAVEVWLLELIKFREKPPKSLVDLLAVTAGEVRQQLKQKQAMLGNDPASDIADALCLLWDDKRDIDEETEDSTS